MRKNAHALTLEGDGFNAMKSDFNQCFNALIEKMISKESESGTIAIKINVTLNDGHAPDLEEVRYAADRDIISPKLEHTITSAFQIKDKKSGFTGGDEYELFWVKEDRCWAIRKIKDAQASLFDNDESDGTGTEEPSPGDSDELPGTDTDADMDDDTDEGNDGLDFEYEPPGDEGEDNE